jgi:hypothetical protein
MSINKPKWENAPEWANYLARDYVGEWWWYEISPHKGMWEWDITTGRAKEAGDVKGKLGLWFNTLERRPKAAQ